MGNRYWEKGSLALGMTFASLMMGGCASNFVGGFNGERHWFNHNLPFYSIGDAWVSEYASCQRVARNEIPAPQVAFAPTGTRYVNGTASVWSGGNLSTVRYNATITDNSPQIAAGYNIGSAFGYALAVSKAEVDCVQSLGWVSVPNKFYTPINGNENIPFNKTFLHYVRNGFSDYRIANGYSFLIDKRRSKFDRTTKAYNLHVVEIFNSEFTTSAKVCQYQGVGGATNVSCDDGSTNRVAITEGSVISQYIGIVSGR